MYDPEEYDVWLAGVKQWIRDTDPNRKPAPKSEPTLAGDIHQLYPHLLQKDCDALAIWLVDIRQTHPHTTIADAVALL